MTESELQNAVVALAQTLKWRVHAERPAQNSRGVWRTAVQGTIGWPDLVLVRGPRLIFAELKSDVGRLRPDQVLWLDALRPTVAYSTGGIVVAVWRPADWLSGEIERELR